MSAVNVPSTRAVDAARTHSKVDAVTVAATSAAVGSSTRYAVAPTMRTASVASSTDGRRTDHSVVAPPSCDTAAPSQ